jgi:hypothetical protein
MLALSELQRSMMLQSKSRYRWLRKSGDDHSRDKLSAGKGEIASAKRN